MLTDSLSSRAKCLQLDVPLLEGLANIQRIDNISMH